MEIKAYLERIKHTNHLILDIQTLYDLHLAHMLAVPFENLDIGLKLPIRITEQAIYEKVVTKNRGGFCYELNGLFAWLLNRTGFNVTYLNARVYDHEGNLGVDFDHLALLVQIPGGSERWLADVGFGDSFTKPLRFEAEDEQIQGLRSYQIEQVPDGCVVWRKNYDGARERLYFFDLQPRIFPDEYNAACMYHQTSPESSFTRGSIITRATHTGRISLEDGRLIITADGNRTEKYLKSAKEYHKFLKKYFNVAL
jgi:N-hydroxyarylamine O-acetyltransferase